MTGPCWVPWAIRSWPSSSRSAALLIASLAELLLPELGALVVVVVLAVIGLLWLRRIIHVGLLQEASEIPIGPRIICPDCGRPTPFHTYCGNCGVSLKALPRHADGRSTPAVDRRVTSTLRIASSRRCRTGTETGLPAGTAAGARRWVGGAGATASATAHSAPGRSGLGQRALLGLFAVVMLGAVLIAAVVAYDSSRDRDKPVCPRQVAALLGVADADGVAGRPTSASR